MADNGPMGFRSGFLALLLFASFPLVWGQRLPAKPFLGLVGPSESRDQQNWSLLQEPSGRVLLGGLYGIAAYNGTSWDPIFLQNQSPAMAMALNSEGRVFVGSFGQMGYLAAQPFGKTQYVSLVEKLPEAERPTTQVLSILPVGKEVLFVTEGRVYVVSGDQVRSIPSRAGFSRGYLLGQRPLVMDRGQGLLEYRNGQFQSPLDLKTLEGKKIQGLYPLNRGRILVAQGEGGFRVHGDPDRGSEALARLLGKGVIYSGTTLPGGGYAFGTLDRGVIGVDAEGRPLWQLCKADGLPDDTVLNLMVDREGALWIACNRGVARAEIGNALWQIDERCGVVGAGLAAAQRAVPQGVETYFGTSKGVFFHDGADPIQPFRRVQGLGGQVFALSRHDNAVLCGDKNGLYELKAGQARRVSNVPWPTHILPLAKHPGTLFLCADEGPYLVERHQGTWSHRSIQGFKEELREALEDEDGAVWAMTDYRGLFRLDWPEGPQSAPRVRRFGAVDGLPEKEKVAFATWHGVLHVATSHEILRWDAKAQRFLGVGAVNGALPAQIDLGMLCESLDGSLWCGYERGAGCGLLCVKDAKVSREFSVFSKFAHLPGRNFTKPLESGPWVFDKTDGFLVLDASRPDQPALPFTTLVHGVVDTQRETELGIASPLRVPYRSNALRFRFGSYFFGNATVTRYRVRLEGLDREWSSWDSKQEREYTNLWEGTYRFLVEARNADGTISQSEPLVVVIRPPWFRAWWALLLWSLLGVLGVYGILRWRTHALRRDKARLELTVAERTEALQQSNEALVSLNERNLRLIEELNQSLAEVKTLQGLIPICSYCKKIRDDQGSWNQLEQYISRHSGAKFSHGICPECVVKAREELIREGLLPKPKVSDTQA